MPLALCSSALPSIPPFHPSLPPSSNKLNEDMTTTTMTMKRHDAKVKPCLSRSTLEGQLLLSLKRMYVKISFFFFSLSLVCLYCPFIVLYFFHVANFLQVFWYQSLRPRLPNSQFKAVMCNDDDVANLLVVEPLCCQHIQEKNEIKCYKVNT